MLAAVINPNTGITIDKYISLKRRVYDLEFRNYG